MNNKTKYILGLISIIILLCLPKCYTQDRQSPTFVGCKKGWKYKGGPDTLSGYIVEYVPRQVDNPLEVVSFIQIATPGKRVIRNCYCRDDKRKKLFTETIGYLIEQPVNGIDFFTTESRYFPISSERVHQFIRE